MLVKWKGQDLGEYSGLPTLKEARKVRSMTGMLPEAFLDGLEKGDPDCVVTLVVIMLSRNGEEVRFDSIDGEYSDFVIELNTQEKERQNKAVAEESINPTIKRILERCDVRIDNDKMEAIVMEELQRAEELGKEETKSEQSLMNGGTET